MYYAIIGEDVADSLNLRLQVRPEHVARLQALVDQGRLLLAGPFPKSETPNESTPGFTGSLIVADFPSLEEARQWANADPYKRTGVYANVVVKPFRLVLP